MTNPSTATTPALLPRIESRIVVIRKLRLMVDADLAALYGVTTKRLNEQVKRNADRFPGDFMFQLNAAEKAEVRGGPANPNTAISRNSAPTKRASSPGKQKDHEQETASQSLGDLQGQGGG